MSESILDDIDEVSLDKPKLEELISEQSITEFGQAAMTRYATEVNLDRTNLQDKPTLIPQYILKIYSHIEKQFSKRVFERRAKQDTRVAKWFEHISKKYGFQVSPYYVYLVSIKSGLTTFAPKRCLYCGKILDISRARHNFCSRECRYKSDIPKMKSKATCFKHYGVTVPAKSKIIKDKIKATCIAKYGVENVYQSKEIKEKIKKANLSRLGVAYPMQSSEVRDKSKQTCLQKYGIENYSQTAEFKEKNKRTMLERYGVDNTLKSKELRKKFTSTMIKRYGVPYSAQSKEIKQKFMRSKHINHFDTFIAILKSNSIEYLSSKQDYIDNKPLHLKCAVCGNDWIIDSYLPASFISCEKCREKATRCRSNKEIEVLEYIKSLYSGKIIHNTKQVISPLELDIYLPDKHLAFEFNGTHWHSENAGTSQVYHFDKTKLCNQQGIRLVHIFEYEWDTNQKKIKSLIRSALGLYTTKLYARQCNVKEVSSKDYEIFLIEHHLQGSVNSSLRYGLYYKDELVSVIGFGSSRYKKNELELHRFCTKTDYLVLGGFSKLVKYACKSNSINRFISYIDLAHFSGNGYKKIGFKKISVTKPSYVYVKGNTILSRYQCQKHKLKKLLGLSYNQDLTETENMMLNSYRKVYDSGTLKVEYTYQASA